VVSLANVPGHHISSLEPMALTDGTADGTGKIGHYADLC
jgi:hypothetical protein